MKVVVLDYYTDTIVYAAEHPAVPGFVYDQYQHVKYVIYRNTKTYGWQQHKGKWSSWEHVALSKVPKKIKMAGILVS